MGLETIFNSCTGLEIAPRPRVGSEATVACWFGAWVRQSCPPSSSQRHWLGSADGQSCCLVSLARLLGQAGFSSKVCEALNLLPCSDETVKQSPWPVQPCWLGTQIRQNCPLNSLAWQGYLFLSADVQSCQLGSPLRCSFKEDWGLPASEHWLLCVLRCLLCFYLIFSGQAPEISPVIPER